MEQEHQEQSEGLYDFLYKDAERLQSYYAQRFAGRLLSLDRSDTERTAKEGGGAIKVSGSGLDGKLTRDRSETTKRTIDPHDLSTVDILRVLLESAVPFDQAAPGQIVAEKGSLLFLENTFMSAMLSAFATGAGQKMPAQTRKAITAFLGKHTFPTLMLLDLGNERRIAGNIRTEYLREPVESFFYLYGGDGMSDVISIGIKESKAIPVASPGILNMGIMPGMREVYGGLHSMIQADIDGSITPLCLMREIQLH